jgi:hypothetical protein
MQVETPVKDLTVKEGDSRRTNDSMQVETPRRLTVAQMVEILSVPGVATVGAISEPSIGNIIGTPALLAAVFYLGHRAIGTDPALTIENVKVALNTAQEKCIIQ